MIPVPVTINMPETSHIHSLSGVKPPKCFSLEGNKTENWKIWTQQWKNYTILSGLSDMINEKQLAMFENCLGVEGLKMCNSLSFTHEETRTVSTILTKMDFQIVGELNDAVTVHRFRTSKPKPAQKQYKPNVMKCHFCGKQHEMLKSKCPAYGKTCKAWQSEKSFFLFCKVS